MTFFSEESVFSGKVYPGLGPAIELEPFRSLVLVVAVVHRVVPAQSNISAAEDDHGMEQQSTVVSRWKHEVEAEGGGGDFGAFWVDPTHF